MESLQPPSNDDSEPSTSMLDEMLYSPSTVGGECLVFDPLRSSFLDCLQMYFLCVSHREIARHLIDAISNGSLEFVNSTYKEMISKSERMRIAFQKMEAKAHHAFDSLQCLH